MWNWMFTRMAADSPDFKLDFWPTPKHNYITIPVHLNCLSTQFKD